MKNNFVWFRIINDKHIFFRHVVHSAPVAKVYTPVVHSVPVVRTVPVAHAVHPVPVVHSVHHAPVVAHSVHPVHPVLVH